MKQKSGKLFVIEGGDGTGKTVQSNLLVDRLKVEGHKVAEVDFPRYGNPPEGHPASFFVRKYLQKNEFGFAKGYGSAAEVNPYAVSIGYDMDRFDASHCQEDKPNLWDLLNDGYIVVANRYTQSNIGYQASKIKDTAERLEFIKWLEDMEYNKLRIPRPDLVLLLDLDPDVARELKAKQRIEQGLALDAHERDSQILDMAREAYLEAAKLFPDNWAVIEVATKVNPAIRNILAGLHTREVIHEKIWAKVKPFLIKE